MRSLIALIVIAASLTTAVFAQAPASSLAGLPNLQERFEALDGVNALAYFELAEEIAYEESSTRALPIARQLYVIAYLVDREADAPLQLGPSVCLALADLADSHADRRWLLMLADSMRGRAIGDGAGADEAASDADELEQLIEALSHFRAGRFRDLRDDLVRIGISISRAQGERLRGGGALEAGAQWAERRFRLAGLEISSAKSLAEALIRAAGTVPCSTCNGSRTVDRRDSEDGAVIGVDLCPACRGMPASLTINDDIDALALRAQALLLEAQPTTWSAQHLIDPAGAPTRDLDPDELAPAFGVDPAARFWQPKGLDPLDGEWVGE